MKIGVPPMPNQNAAKKAGMAKDVRERFEYEKVELAIIRRAPSVKAPDEAAREQHRPYSRRLLDRAFWSLATSLHWVAFRDADKLENDADAVSRAIMQSKKYEITLLKEDQPEECLLDALQSGTLTSLKDGVELKPETWALCEVGTGRLQPTQPGVALRRKDVLRLWPELKKGTGDGAKPRLGEAEITALIVKEQGKCGGFISQKNGYELIRAIDPGWPREGVVRIVKSVTHNDKRGPRGPRKKVSI